MTYRDVRARCYLIFSVLLYIQAFLYSYETWVVPRYESWGMAYRDVPLGYSFTSWFLCVVAAFWMPRNLTRPSQLLLFIQYFIIFIPASFILYHSGRPEFPPEEVLNIVLVLFLGLTILQVSYKIPLVSIENKNVSRKVFQVTFLCSCLVLFLYLFSVFGTHFQLTDFQGIYDVRAVADELIAASGSSFSGYAQMWLSGFFLPFLFSIGIFQKRWRYVIFAAIGYFYLVGIGGSKSNMLAMVYLLAIYFLVRHKGIAASVNVALCFSGLLLFPALFILMGAAGETADKWYVAIIHSRIFSIPQLSIGQYYDFFKDHPYTYGSHITGVNLLIDYPYDMDIPRTVGKYFYDAELTENVNMWAQDGIVSFGLIGVPVVSVIAAFVFWVFDCIALRHGVGFSTVALGNIALIFANGSLFTTIVSGGWLWLMIALYFFPAQKTAENMRTDFSL